MGFLKITGLYKINKEVLSLDLKHLKVQKITFVLNVERFFFKNKSIGTKEKLHGDCKFFEHTLWANFSDWAHLVDIRTSSENSNVFQYVFTKFKVRAVQEMTKNRLQAKWVVNVRANFFFKQIKTHSLANEILRIYLFSYVKKEFNKELLLIL